MADDQPTLADIFREVTRLERALSDSAAHWQQRCKELEAERDAVRSIVESIVYAAPETWPLHLERLAQLVLKERTNG